MCSVGSLRRRQPQSLGQGRTDSDAVSETLCFPVFRIPANGQIPEAQSLRLVCTSSEAFRF
jgi:hypothetical protein